MDKKKDKSKSNKILALKTGGAEKEKENVEQTWWLIVDIVAYCSTERAKKKVWYIFLTLLKGSFAWYLEEGGLYLLGLLSDESLVGLETTSLMYIRMGKMCGKLVHFWLGLYWWQMIIRAVKYISRKLLDT